MLLVVAPMLLLSIFKDATTNQFNVCNPDKSNEGVHFNRSFLRGDRSTVYHIIIYCDTTEDVHIYSFSVMNEQDQHDSHLSSSADVDDTKPSATVNDGTTATATATSPPIVDMEDVWATSEGYTPLQDFNLMLQQSTPTATTTTSSNIHPHTNESNVVVPTSSGAFFSDGTTGGTIFTSCPGAFYASIAQQQQQQLEDDDDDEWENDGGDDDDEVLDVHEDYNYLHNEDDDDDDDEDDDGDMTTTAATTTTTTSTSFYDSIPDYRSVADNALLMLDREYNNIVSLPRLLQQQQQRRMDNEPVVVEEADHDHNDDTDDDSNNINNNNDDSQWVIDGGTNETNNVDSIDSVLSTTLMMMTPPPPPEPKKIDTEAVRRAVRTIQSKNPKLEQNLRRWEKTQQLQHLVPPLRPHPPSSMTHPHHHHHHPSCSSMAPRLHPIIPELPLTAFRKFNSSKAIQATANLTRSVCIAEALHRYNILQYHLHQEQTIRIHILGCDHVEIGYHNTNVRSSSGGGRSNDTTATDERRPVENAFLDPTRIRTLFGPIVRWVGAYAEAPSHIRIELIGPNIPKHVAAATKASPMDLLLPKRTTTTTHHRTGNFGGLQSATLRCHSGTYEEILEHDVGTNDVGVPDLAIAFNAGVWGYQEWATTIRYMILHQSQSIPFVITAYTFEEAEDDYDTISDIVKECRSVDHNKEVQCVWDVEHNPFASNQDYQQHSSTATIASTLNNSSRRRENAAWQSWRL